MKRTFNVTINTTEANEDDQSFEALDVEEALRESDLALFVSDPLMDINVEEPNA